MKNSLKNILAISASILFFTGCEVERLPETNISDATFWRSESDLKTANNYLYTFLPDFGTRIYEYIFDQNDMVTFNLIEEEIRDGVKKYIPNLDINSINIMSAENDPDETTSFSQEEDERLFRVSEQANKPYTAKVKIDYTVNNGAFSSSDFIIINI